jgi:hypothetical protein
VDLRAARYERVDLPPDHAIEKAIRLRQTSPPNIRFLGGPARRGPLAAREEPSAPGPVAWYEAAPRSILEAYAAGVRVVASRIGVLPEAVEDSVTGLLADPHGP